METRILILRVVLFSILFFVILFNIQIEGIYAPDTAGYIDVSNQWFNSSCISYRPVGYPLIMRVSELLMGNYRGVVILQALTYLASFVLLLFINSSLSRRLGGSNKLLIVLDILSFIGFMSPQSISSISLLLPEILPILPVLLIIYLLSRSEITKYGYILVNSLVLIAILIKPIWILLIPLIVLSAFLDIKIKRERIKRLLFILLPIGILYFGVYTYMTKSVNISPNTNRTSTFDVNLNLALIRSGAIKQTEDTDLGKHLILIGAFSEFIGRKWDNSKEEYGDFTNVKNLTPWLIRGDKKFWKNALVIRFNMRAFLIAQGKRLHSFITVSGSNGRVILPMLNYYYQGFYNKMHKILLPIIILFIGVMSVWMFVLKIQVNLPLIITDLGLMILLSWLVLTVLTYQDSHFLRMRASIEPLLIYTLLAVFVFQLKSAKSGLFGK